LMTSLTTPTCAKCLGTCLHEKVGANSELTDALIHFEVSVLP
jgi:hypothetical protein